MIVRGETSAGKPNRPAREERAAHDDRMRRAAQSWRSRWQHPAVPAAAAAPGPQPNEPRFVCGRNQRAIANAESVQS
jgi:hypothetical protein